MQRSKQKSGMNSRDLRSGTWLAGWGHDRQLMRQLERRSRDRDAEAEVWNETCEEWGCQCRAIWDLPFQRRSEWEVDLQQLGLRFFNEDPLDAVLSPGNTLVWQSERITPQKAAELLRRRMDPDEVEDFLTK